MRLCFEIYSEIYYYYITKINYSLESQESIMCGYVIYFYLFNFILILDLSNSVISLQQFFYLLAYHYNLYLNIDQLSCLNLFV